MIRKTRSGFVVRLSILWGMVTLRFRVGLPSRKVEGKGLQSFDERPSVPHPRNEV